MVIIATPAVVTLVVVVATKDLVQLLINSNNIQIIIIKILIIIPRKEVINNSRLVKLQVQHQVTIFIMNLTMLVALGAIQVQCTIMVHNLNAVEVWLKGIMILLVL